jgi:lycopene cyclase domain-containing protein
MTKYSIFTVAVVVVSTSVSLYILKRCNLLQSFRTAGLIAFKITVIAYPWDFFAIQLGAWTFPQDPGFRLYGVPINDSLFIWACSLLTVAVLISILEGQRSRDGHTKREHADK